MFLDQKKILKTANTSDIYSWQTITFYYTYIDISGTKISNFSLVYKGLECLDLIEKNRKQMFDQIKKILNPEFRKKSDAWVDRVKKKRMLDTRQFQIHGSEKN